MKCRKCGAVLLDTDTFCVKCGQKVGGPIFCLSCGEQLRDEERFCHKCGAPVETAAEDDEIPLSQQKTVDIPFDQIEQGILMEAEQAIVKRPRGERQEQRDPQGYSRPGTEMPPGYERARTGDTDGYHQPKRREAGAYQEESYISGQKRDASYYEDDGEVEPYGAPARAERNASRRSRYEEDYGEYEAYDEDEDDEEDSGDARMKVVTVILGIVVVAVMLAVGFILWQRNSPSRYERPEEGTEQGEEDQGDSENGSGEDNGDGGRETQGRIQILSNVNVRNKPTTEGSEVLMVAKQGETYEYYELVDEAWYHIRLEDGGEGYVSEKYVEDLQ